MTTRVVALMFTLLVMLAGGGAAAAQSASSAQAVLKHANGETIGTLTLTEESGGVRITGTLSGVPAGEHGFHLHAVGLCEAPDFKSAGGHFNPASAQHGLNNPSGPHAGDLPNLTVGTEGSTTVNLLAERVTLSTGANALLDSDGAAIVIHEGPDDNVSDPAGNSGARIVCGVISTMPATLPTTGDDASFLPLPLIVAAGLLLILVALSGRSPTLR